MFYALVSNGDRIEVREMTTPRTRGFCDIPTYMVEFHSFDREIAMRFAREQYGENVVDVVWHCCDNPVHLIERSFNIGYRFAQKRALQPQ